MDATLVRMAHWKIDIKIVNGNDMHILQWRRHMSHDEVLLDGKVQQISRGMWGRETIYGLVFGRDAEGNGGTRVMFVVDPSQDMNNASYWLEGQAPPKGVRLETAEQILLAFGSLDERAYDQPADFAEWAKQKMGIKW